MRHDKSKNIQCHCTPRTVHRVAGSGFHVTTVTQIRRKKPIENTQSGVRLLTYGTRKYFETRNNTEKQQNFAVTILRFHFARHNSIINVFYFLLFSFFVGFLKHIFIINIKTLCTENPVTSISISVLPSSYGFSNDSARSIRMNQANHWSTCRSKTLQSCRKSSFVNNLLNG